MDTSRAEDYLDITMGAIDERDRRSRIGKSGNRDRPSFREEPLNYNRARTLEYGQEVCLKISSLWREGHCWIVRGVVFTNAFNFPYGGMLIYDDGCPFYVPTRYLLNRRIYEMVKE